MLRLLPTHVLRSAAALSIAALLAGCSGPIAKSARNDRGHDDPDGPSGTTIGSPIGTSGPARCTEGTATTELEPVYLAFVVDGSGSMKDDGKWTAVVDSVKLIVDQVATSSAGSVGMGMIGFADALDPTGKTNGVYGPYPTSADVPLKIVDAAHAQALKARLDTTPDGLTPTQPALEGGYAMLRAFNPPQKGRKILVLITDGFPFSSIDTATQVVNSIYMADQQASSADPILTFAVGVGSFPGDGVEYDPTFVGRLAAAGRTARFPSCNPYENQNESAVCHFQVTPGFKSALELRQAAVDAINAIRAETKSCTFKITPPPAGYQLDSRAISVQHKPAGGAPSMVFPSAENGWSVDDVQTPTALTLNGAACLAYRQTEGSVEVLLACR